MKLSPETSLPRELNAILLRSQQRTAYAMAILCLFLVVVQSLFIGAMFGLLKAAPDYHPAWLLLLPLIAACIGIYEFASGREAGRRLRENLSPRPPILNALCEAALPSIGVILFAFATDWPTALRSPPVLGYFIILMLSVLRLDARICVLVGLLEAASFLGLTGWSFRTAVAGSISMTSLTFHLATAVLLMLTTIVAAFIARQMRMVVFDLIKSHRKQARTARALATSTDAHHKAEAIIWQKDRMLSLLGHDLRTPLNGVAGLSELMARTPERFTAEEIRRYAAEIHQTSRSLRELVDNLIALAQMRTGQLPCDPAPQPLDASVSSVLRLFAPAFQNKAITTTVELPENLSIFADRGMFRTVLRNLFSNAVKFTPRNGRVEISGHRDNHHAILHIRNSGDGFPENVANQLAAGETVASTSGTENESGSGIGLLLCREFMERLGGKLTLVPGENALVQLEIPLEESSAATAPEIRS